MENNPSHPFSQRFDEHYWSGGAAEKSHVFLGCNNLPTRFAAAQVFTVAELGFGTALNFLLTASLWQTTTAPQARLTYISYELDPLPLAQLTSIHTHFPESLQSLSHRFLALYQPEFGWNTLHLTPTITLHLYVGNATTGLATHPQPADAWFFDGFSPNKNPELWTPELFTTIARHTNSGGTASTYTVAHRVQRALTAAGFEIALVRGHPPKYQNLAARLTGTKKEP